MGRESTLELTLERNYSCGSRARRLGLGMAYEFAKIWAEKKNYVDRACCLSIKLATELKP
jgi:hypothetical protein